MKPEKELICRKEGIPMHKQKVSALFLSALTAFTLLVSGCSGAKSSGSSTAAPSGTNASASAASAVTDIVRSKEGNPKKILVVYFTYAENTDASRVTSKSYDAATSASIVKDKGSLTGNNTLIARAIADRTGADMLSLRTREPYSPDYDAVVKESREDIPKGILPALQNGKVPADQYDTLILVYPVWWYKVAPAMTAFLKENDFAGKDIYVFVSSGGTGFGDTLQEVQDLQPKARIHEGAAIRQEDAAKAGSSVDSVLAKAKLGK